jgi:nitroreductase
MIESCVKKIQERRSIRRYSDEPVKDEDIQEILKTGFSAPSAGNRQPWRVVKVTQNRLKERLALAAGGQSFLSRAPIVFVVCAVPQESGERYRERGLTLYALQDTAALTQNILLAIHFLGYASCWIGAFDEKQVIDLLNIPQEIRPVALVPVAKMHGNLPPKPRRRPWNEVVINESF